MRYNDFNHWLLTSVEDSVHDKNIQTINERWTLRRMDQCPQYGPSLREHSTLTQLQWTWEAPWYYSPVWSWWGQFFMAGPQGPNQSTTVDQEQEAVKVRVPYIHTSALPVIGLCQELSDFVWGYGKGDASCHLQRVDANHLTVLKQHIKVNKCILKTHDVKFLSGLQRKLSLPDLSRGLLSCRTVNQEKRHHF